MAKKLTIISTKGGVGKTTLAANLGAAIADLGQRVLLIDADKQQSLSNYYPLLEQATNGLKEMIQLGCTNDCISTTNINTLDIVVNNINDPNSMTDYHSNLVTALESLDPLYDVIIIDTDCLNDTGSLQQVAMRASDFCVSPLSPNWLINKALANSTTLLNKFEPSEDVVKGRATPPLTMIVWCKQRGCDSQTSVDNLIRNDDTLFQRYFRQANGKFAVLKTTVTYTTAYQNATRARIPIHRYEPKRSDSIISGANTMLSLAYELFSHLDGIKFKEIKS